VYDLSAKDAATGAPVSQFAAPPTLTLKYTPVTGVTPQIYYLDPVNGPTPVASTVDAVAGTVSAQLAHFSPYVAGSAPLLSGTAGNDSARFFYNVLLGRLQLDFANPATEDKEVDKTALAVTIDLGGGDDVLTIENLGDFKGALAIVGGSGKKRSSPRAPTRRGRSRARAQASCG